MALFNDNTPTYEGAGQPAAGASSDGLLSGLTSLFTGVLGGGGATPEYAGDGQPVARRRGLLLFGQEPPQYVQANILAPDPDAEPPPNPDEPSGSLPVEDNG